MRSDLVLSIATGVAGSLSVLLLPASVWAQTEVYCTVTDVKSEALTNATRVTIQADGILEVDLDGSEYWEREGNDWGPRRRRILPFRIVNARTRLGSFVDVGIYPISHISFLVPRESREGVGLDVSVVLYRGAILESIQVQWTYWGSWQAWESPPSFIMHQSRDGRTLNIAVRSDRYREVGIEREAAEAGRSSLSVTADEEGRLSVHALNSPLGDVLRAISERNGIQIAVRGGANYRASMALKNASPAAVMRAIARAYGLSVRAVGGIYYVTEGLPTEVDAYWAAPTAVFRLQHTPVDVALNILPDFLLRYVHADAEQNALVATGPPPLLDKLDEDLRTIDRPQPQIELSALLVEERATDGLDLASDIIVASGEHELQVLGETGLLSYRRVEESISDLQVKLRALEQDGSIHTEVCPSVTVGSGEEAEIFLGKRHFFQFLTSGSDQEVVLESTDVGSLIASKPWTGDAQTITVPLRIQANTVLSIDDKGLPLVATREVRGTVRLDSGHTIVLGGLAIDVSDRSRRKAGPNELPIGGDIGRARRGERTRNEVLVLLSVRASYRTSEFAGQPEPATEPEQG